jgi:mono/diheme cytochrome c family protein
MIRAIIFWTLLSCLPAVRAASTVSVSRQGDAIFHQRCIQCHNQQPGDAVPFGPPNLYSAFRGQNAITSKEAETIITGGKGQMPAFGSILSRDEIRSIISYLRTRR